MRTIHAPKTRLQLRYRRHLRVRRKVSGTAERPRLVVYRSLKHIYAQLDRAGYRYHGRVQAVADGAREGGLEF
jgi:large subunit ribosomal protein L18